MSFKPKTLFTLLTGILFIFSTNISFAQYPGMKAIYHNMDMQQAQHNMAFTMMYMNNNSQFINPKYLFKVKFKDSSEKEISSEIYIDTSNHKTYLLLVDRNVPKSDSSHRWKKFYVDQTVSITRKELFNSSDNTGVFKGLANDTCWMFKAIHGTISIYSYLSEYGINFDPSTIVGIQLNEGPIVKFNAENIKPMIEKDHAAIAIFDKKKYFKAIRKFNYDAEKASKK